MEILADIPRRQLVRNPSYDQLFVRTCCSIYLHGTWGIAGVVHLIYGANSYMCFQGTLDRMVRSTKSTVYVAIEFAGRRFSRPASRCQHLELELLHASLTRRFGSMPISLSMLTSKQAKGWALYSVGTWAIHKYGIKFRRFWLDNGSTI